ncbi:TonB family protein [Sphingomonas sp. ASY06-1R]|uniref:TonB family protein n=1 Tax=Sphingomonas sp. ASY06-1R TaxID=3445771 RepID=UPI003FA314AF
MIAPRPLRERLVAGLGVAAIEVALGLALLLVLTTRFAPPRAPPATLLESPPVLIPPPAPERPHARAHSGPAAPRNLRAKPTPLVVPPPLVALAPPPPIIAAPVASTGAAARAGASDLPGPGTGAGGIGAGLGGGGDGGGDGMPPRHIRGRIRDGDFPRALAEAGAGGTVGVRYRVGINGRVGDCSVTRSSGNADLDALTCRLIQQRFRFDPSRDGAGRKVPSIIVENHSWLIERLPSPPAGTP